jgi:hypothetical protein
MVSQTVGQAVSQTVSHSGQSERSVGQRFLTSYDRPMTNHDQPLPPLLYVSHSEVIYHGRLLEFNKLSKPNKANKRSKLPSSLPYSGKYRMIFFLKKKRIFVLKGDETVSCICPFDNIVNWLNSFKIFFSNH